MIQAFSVWSCQGNHCACSNPARGVSLCRADFSFVAGKNRWLQLGILVASTAVSFHFTNLTAIQKLNISFAMRLTPIGGSECMKAWGLP